MHRALPLIFALAIGCGKPTATIGYGAAEEFTAYEAGDSVGLVVAPQGGFGISVRLWTTALQCDAPVEVLMETWLGDERTGTFTNPSVQLYCQGGSKAMLWGIVVGFDPEVYSTNEDLLDLDGETIRLEITATDSEGTAATGEVDIVVDVGG